jgi:hypothetical protein
MDEKASGQSGERSSRPGAVSVSASQQAALLDQRIAEKTRSVPSSAGPAIVDASLESVRDDATSGARHKLHESESAVQAQMVSDSGPSEATAQQNAQASAAVSSRPGAYAATSLPIQTNALQGLEADAQAKQRALVGAFAESLDAKIATKMRGDVSQINSSHSVEADVSSKNMARALRPANAQPGAYAVSGSTLNNGKEQTAGCNELESAIAAKLARWEASASPTAHSQPGAYASSGSALADGKQQTAGLNELESAIAAKMARWEAGTSQTAQSQPGAYASSETTLKNGKEQTAGLNELESAVAAKLARWEASATPAQPGAYAATLADGKQQTAGLNELESAIAAKLARWEAGASQTAQAQPGTYSASGSTLAEGKQQTAGMSEMESAIAAKMARWESGASPTAQTETGTFASTGSTLVNGGCNELESAFAAKLARWEEDASQTAQAQPGAYSFSGSTFKTAGLSELESAIADKMARWEAGASQTAQAQPGTYAATGSTLANGKQPTAGFNELESAIAAKMARWEAGASQTAQAQPGAYGATLADGKKQIARLNELESAIAARLARWEVSATFNTLEDSAPSRARSHDTKAPITDDVEAKIHAHVPDSNAPLTHFEKAVQAKIRTNGGEGAESQSVHAATTPYQHLQNLESVLHAKLCSNSSDSLQGKSVDSLDELHTLEANVQSKMNRTNEAAASKTLLLNFENDSMCQQQLGSETAGEQGEASATHPRIPLEIQDIETSVPQHADEGMLNDDDRFESKVPQNDCDDADQGPDLENGEYGNLEENGLAVAFAVEEEEDYLPLAMDEEEEYIPSAVEYDPDAKPPMNSRFQLYACLTMVVMVVGTLGTLACILISRSGGTPPPLPERATLGIREYVEQLVGPEPMSDANNPYRKALDWIQNVDPMALTSQDKGFAQRFLTTYLYFSTTVHGPWNNDCDPAQQGETDDTVYRYTGVIDENINFALDAKRWLSKHDSCLWCAVECDSAGQVIKIDIGTLPPSSWRARTRWVSLSLLFMCSFPRLARANMTGTIPEGVTKLPYLRFLSLSHGQLVGPLPAAYSDMKHLDTLEVAGNRLTGTIPESLYSSRSLQRVVIGKNLLVGTISKEIGRLKDLLHWYSYENGLTGTIPAEVGDLHNAVRVWMKGNLHTGMIPSSVGTIRRILDFVVYRNKLTGTVPAELGGASTLQYLQVHFNKMTGTLPTELATLTDLQYLYLNDNQFWGGVDVLTNLTNLGELHIENNKFGGSLSRDFSRLTEMWEFTASGNEFTGSVPEVLCNLVEPANKPGSSKILSVLEMDCMPSADGAVEIDCPCCTTCCDAMGLYCKPST